MGEHSLVLVQEPRHKYLRGLLQPAFSGAAIAGYLPAMQQLVTRHLAEWEAVGEVGVQGYDGLKLLTYEFIISVSEALLILHIRAGLTSVCAESCPPCWFAVHLPWRQLQPTHIVLPAPSATQITLGREYSRQEVLALSEHYKEWTGGFLAWPWWVLQKLLKAPACLCPLTHCSRLHCYGGCGASCMRWQLQLSSCGSPYWQL
jgi:hypothetical protein